VGDATAAWMATQPRSLELDRNLDVYKAASVVTFPIASSSTNNDKWADYMESEIDPTIGEGFDELDKGIMIL
jgi:hypothetical protein